MNAKLIARVSTDHQDGDLRMSELRNYAKVNNHRIVGEYWVYESATIDLQDRKDFMKALQEDNGEEIVIINKLDRLTRNFKTISWFEDYLMNARFKLIALDFIPDLSNAIGRYIFRQLLTISCFESEQMKERQEPGIAKAKANGKFKGRKKGAVGRK